MSDNLDVAVRLRASVDQFTQGINKASGDFASALANIRDTSEQTGSAVEAALGKLGLRRHAEIEQEIKGVEDAYKQLADSGELSMRELAQAKLRMTERVKELRQETNGWGQSLIKMKAELATAGAAIYGITRTLSSAARESSTFATALAEVSTLLDDTSQLDGLRREVERLSLEFGGDVTTNAKALYQIISAGASDAAQATELLTASNKLAIGGVTDVATAADGLTSIINAYGAAAGGANNVSDAMFTAMKAGKTTIGELSASIGQVAPMAAQAGVGIEELLGSVAALTKGGVATTEAMTQVRAILTAVVKPSSQAAKMAKELGLEFNTTAVRSKGLASWLQEVKDKTGGNEEVMSQLFGRVEALNAVFALTGNAANDFANILESMGDKAGSTEEAVGKMMDTPAVRAARFEQALSSVHRSLGDAVTALSPLLEGLTGLINVFNSLDPATRMWLAGLGTLAVTLPAIVFALGRFKAAIDILRIGFVMATGATTAHTAAVNTNTAAINANAAAATRAGGLIKSAGAVAASGWIGWEIGTYLRNEFEVVEKAGIALAAGLTEVAARAKFAWEVIQSPGDALAAYDRLQAKLQDIDDQYADMFARVGQGSEQAAQQAQAAGDATAAGVGAAAAGAELLSDALKQVKDALEQIGDADLSAAIADLEAIRASGNLTLAEMLELDRLTDQVMRESFKRLGLDADQSLGLISQKAGDAVAALDAIRATIDNATVDGEVKMQALGAAIEKALAGADTLAAAEAVRARIEEMGKTGELVGQQLERAMREAQGRIDELTPGIGSVTEAYQQLGLTAPDALKKAAAAAREAYEVIRNSGATVAEQQRAWLAYAQAAIAANDGVADAALRAEAAVLGVAEQLDKIDGSAQRAAEAMAKVAAAHTQHINEAERATTALEREGAANVAAARAALEHAKAQGDLTEARRLEIAVADAQVESAANIAKAKMAEVAAAERLVAALQAEAEADGVVLDTERQAIEQAQQVVDAKREAAAAAQQAADAAKREADALRQAAATMREVSVDLVQWAQSVGVAAEQVDAFLDIVDRLRQAYYADGGSAEFAHEAETQWTNVAKAAAAAWQKFVDAKSAGESAANGIANATGNAADETRKLEAAARNAMQYSSALGAERLAQLRAALDDAQRKMQDLKDEAADTLAQLNDELAQMQGRYVDAQKARNAQRRAELQAQLEEARAAGNTDAVAQLVKAMRVLDQIAAAQLEEAKAREAEARERAKEQPAPDAAPTPEPQTQAPVPPPSRSTQPVPPPAPQGRSTNWQIHVSVSGNLDPERLARELKPHLERIMRLTE